IRFRLAGDGAITGVDNGDQVSNASFKADRVRLFNGKALVIVRAGEREGTATLTAEADGLAPAVVRIALGTRPRGSPAVARQLVGLEQQHAGLRRSRPGGPEDGRVPAGPGVG